MISPAFWHPFEHAGESINMKHVIPAVFAALATGCAQTSVQLYEGATLPVATVATIRAWSPSIGNVAVLKIDGKEVQTGNVSHAYVLPGPHTLTVRFVNGLLVSVQAADLPMNAQAGHTYVVQANPDVSRMQVKYWIDDKGLNYDSSCLVARPFEKGGVSGKNC